MKSDVHLGSLARLRPSSVGRSLQVSRDKRGWSSRQNVVWLYAVLAALPALVAAVVSVGADWTPASDYAPIEVRIRDVFSSHPPVLGPYSRLGGNHPGPLMFYVLSIPHRLLGGQAWTLLVGAALINAACIALTVRIAGRKGQAGLAALTGLLTLAAVWGLGVEHVRDVWNPRLPVLPFLLAAMASWAVVVGSRRSLPVALVAASFCAQSHVGYMGLAAVLSAWAVYGVWRHRADSRSWRGPIVASALLLSLIWALPLGQQVFGEQGNLTRIFVEANNTGEPKYGWSGVNGLLLPHLGPTPAWFRATQDDPFELRGRSGLGFPPMGLVAFAAGLVVALRRRDRDPLALLLVTASLWIVGAVSISQLSGIPGPYLYRWVRPLGVLLWAAALWPLGRALRDALRESGRRRMQWATGSRSLLVINLLFGAVAVGVSVGETGTPFREYREKYQQTSVVADEVVSAVGKRVAAPSVVEVKPRGAVVFSVAAVVGELERSGYDVTIENGEGAAWGGHRRPGTREADVTAVLADSLDFASPPSANLERVTSVDKLTPEQRRDYQALAPLSSRCDELARALNAGEDTAASTAELDQCRRLSELKLLDGKFYILIGRPADP